MNHEQSTANADDLTVEGCVCPQCYKPLKAPAVVDYPADRYGCRTRSYAGMCFGCRQACKVTQFEQNDKWRIHQYLPHRYESGQFVGVGDWITVNPLPEQPPVLTGPGGDFGKVPDPSYDPAISAIEAISSLILLTTKALGNILKELTRSHNNEPNNRKH